MKIRHNQSHGTPTRSVSQATSEAQRQVRTQVRLRVVAIALVVAGIAVAGPATMSSASEKVLSLTAYAQESRNWCWAAAAKMIIKYETGKVVSQCNIVKKGKGTSGCADVAGTKANVQLALDTYGVNPGDLVAASWSRDKAEINSGRLIYSSIRWNDGTGGHAHVIRGWYDTGYSYGVSYVDPATGTVTSREWGTYLSNSTWTAGSQLIYLYKE